MSSSKLVSLSWVAVTLVIVTLAVSSHWFGATYAGTGLWAYGRTVNGSFAEVSGKKFQVTGDWWIGYVGADEVVVQRIPGFGRNLYWTTTIFSADKDKMCSILKSDEWQLDGCPVASEAPSKSVSECIEENGNQCIRKKVAMYFPDMGIGTITVSVAPGDIDRASEAVSTLLGKNGAS